MKNLKTYENWLNENSITTVGDKIQFAGKPVEIIGIEKRESQTILKVKDIIGKIFNIRYDDDKGCYVIDEFEGSLGPTTLPLSTMLLATQPGSPTITF